MAVFLHPKSASWSTNPVAFHWTAATAEMAMRLGFGIELDPVRSFFHPNAKERRLSDLVRLALSERGPFETLVDVSGKLEDWTRESNHGRSVRDSGLAPAILFEEERIRLRPLKEKPEDIPFRFAVWVRANGTVLFEGNVLFVSPEVANRYATLNLYPDRVQLVAGSYEAWQAWPPSDQHE